MLKAKEFGYYKDVKRWEPRERDSRAQAAATSPGCAASATRWRRRAKCCCGSPPARSSPTRCGGRRACCRARRRRARALPAAGRAVRHGPRAGEAAARRRRRRRGARARGQAARGARPALPRRAFRAGAQARRAAAREPYRRRSGAAGEAPLLRAPGRRVAALRLCAPHAARRGSRARWPTTTAARSHERAGHRPLLVGVLVVLGVAWFLATHDRVDAAGLGRAVGRGAAARRSSPRSASPSAWDCKVSEVRSLPELDALPARRRAAGAGPPPGAAAARIAELLRWVDNGGHLIVEAESLGVRRPAARPARRQALARPSALRKPLALELPGPAAS